ncbi:MAG: phytanoyl-CoA dioxygenase family protein [Halobacteriaceae archaeon]
MPARVGDYEFELGGDHLSELRESDPDDDAVTLRRRLAADGYLLFRGFHDEDAVRRARGDLVDHLDDEGLLDPSAPPEEARVGDEDRGAFVGGGGPDHAARFPDLTALVEGESVLSFFGRLLDDEPFTYDYKWARATEPGGFTGFHYDRVYMGRGTEDLFTLWTPLGDVPVEMGPLLVCEGSNHFRDLRETYGQVDVDRDDAEGAFSSDPLEVTEQFGGEWKTADFEAGDAIVFGPYTLHGSLANQTDRYRLSTDTRYQGLSDPVDGRWVGADPIGHYNWTGGEVSMDELRERWGL